LSPHDETNDYGISKSLGELGECTIVRTSIIGEEQINKRSLLEWTLANKGGNVNGYINHLWNGVTCFQLSNIIYDIIQKEMFWKGVRHIFSPTQVSKYELVCLINEIYDLRITINEYQTPQRIDKTLASIYDTCYVFNIPSLKQQIQEQKEFTLHD
jgi:dTDP-4-dehydrorhamnose reductase